MDLTLALAVCGLCALASVGVAMVRGSSVALAVMLGLLLGPIGLLLTAIQKPTR